jgi:hypothetical protein
MSRNRPWVVLGTATGLLLTSTSLLAHHSGALYDRDRTVNLTGIVTQYEFTNPHTRIFIDVKTPEGSIEKWVAESAPPQRLFRSGWRTDSLKPGDQVTVSGSPMKDGSKFLTIRKLTAPGGKELTQGAE